MNDNYNYDLSGTLYGDITNVLLDEIKDRDPWEIEEITTRIMDLIQQHLLED